MELGCTCISCMRRMALSRTPEQVALELVWEVHVPSKA